MADPKLPAGYTLDEPVNLPSGYTLDAAAPVTNALDNPKNQLLYTTPEGIPVYGGQGQEAVKQPEGSAAQRFGQGYWANTGGGLIEMAKLLLRGAAPALGGSITPETAEAMGGLVRSHIDQSQAAQEAWRAGRHTEAFGHALATILPMIGPAAAAAGDQMGGEPGQLDRYGRVVKQGRAPDLAGGLGAGAGQLTMASLPAVARGVKAADSYVRAGSQLMGGNEGVMPTLPAVSAPKLESRLNPIEQQAIDFLRQNDVHLDVPTITGNKAVRAVGAITQNQPLGAGTAMESAKMTEQGLRRVAGELADRAHPQPTTQESAGAAVSKEMGGRIGKLADASNEGYSKAWEGRDNPAYTYDVPVRREPVLDAQGKPTGEMRDVNAPVNMPVDVRDIKEALKPVFDEMQWMPAADRNASAGYAAVQRLLNGPDFIPAWQAENGLSGIKTMARTANKTGVRNQSQGIGASIVGPLQEQIDAAVAHTGDEAIRGLQEGRALHATKMELADLVEKLRVEPVQAFKQLTWGQDTGIEFLRQIARETPDQVPQVGRALIQSMFDDAMSEGGFRKARTLLTKWEGIGPQTKALLFKDPALRTALDRFFKGAEMISHNPNPSGSAVVGSLIPGGLLMVHQPVSGAAWLMSGYALSKLLFSPRGVALLTRALEPQAGASGAAVAEQIVRMAGKEGVQSVGAGMRQRIEDFLQDEEGTQKMPKWLWRPGAKLTEIPENAGDMIPRENPKQLVVSDVQRYLNEQVVKKLGEIEAHAPPKKKLQRILQLGRKEFADQLDKGPEESGLEWYDGDRKLADAHLEQIFPELGSNPVRHALQKAISAVMSNSSKPVYEAFNGATIYEHYRESGRIPMKQPNGLNWPAQGATPQLAKIQAMLDQLTEEGFVEYILSRQTVADMKRFRPGMEGKATDVLPGSLVLGPKIGRYFRDIMGLPQEGSTVDIWDVRGNMRRLGRMFDENSKPIEVPSPESDRAIFMEGHKRIAEENGISRNGAQSVLWHYEQDLYRRLGLNVESTTRSSGTARYLRSKGITPKK